MKKNTNKNSLRAAICCIGIIVVATICVLVVYLTGLVKTVENEEDVSGDTNTSQNQDQSSDNESYLALKTLDSQGVLDFIATGQTGFLYAGRPTCPHCQVFEPMLTEALTDRKISAYYYDTEAANVDRDKKSEALEVIDVSAVPSFLYIQNGVIVDSLDDVSSEEALSVFLDNYR